MDQRLGSCKARLVARAGGSSGAVERNLVLLWELHKLEVCKEIGNLGSFPPGEAACEGAFVQGRFVFT